MSAGKRLAKRSIVGTRICAPFRETGQYNPGVIIGSKNPDELNFNNCHTGITSNSKYIVRFESGDTREFSESELVGPGFGSVNSLKLRSGQKTFVTHNGREVTGNVVYHRPQIDEVLITIPPSPGSAEVSSKIILLRRMCYINYSAIYSPKCTYKIHQVRVPISRDYYRTSTSWNVLNTLSLPTPTIYCM